MGILDKFTGRKATTEPVVVSEAQQKNNEEKGNVSSGSDSDSLDLVDRNEKEIRENPDQITGHAQPGVQKAEAVALVWSRGAVYAIYAW